MEDIFVKDGERCWLVSVVDIFLLEPEGKYTRLHFANERPLISRSLTALEERIDSAMFFRADRKHVHNLKWVERDQNQCQRQSRLRTPRRDEDRDVTATNRPVPEVLSL